MTTVNLPTASTTPSVATVTTTTPAAITTIVATQTIAAVQSVSRAGGTLNPTAVAESQQRDNTATRAFTAAQIKVINIAFLPGSDNVPLNSLLELRWPMPGHQPKRG